MKKLYGVKYIVTIFMPMLFVLNSAGEVVVNTLSDLDRQYLEDYILFDKEKPIEEVEIIDYIAGKIHNSTGDFYVDVNSCKLISKLEQDHIKYFDDILIEFIDKRLSDENLTFKKLINKPIIQISMVTLGYTRTKKSIEYLFQLLEPYNQWPKKIKENMENKNDNQSIEEIIRYRAMGGLLEPKDDKGKELIPLIEEELNAIQNESFKAFMLDALDTWKFIYSSNYVEKNWMY